MVKNLYGKEVITNPFMGIKSTENEPRKMIDEVLSTRKDKLMPSIESVFDAIPVRDGMTLSFHHHLRNGDHVANKVFEVIKRRNLKDITIAMSSIFPVHAPLVELIENQNVVKVISSYMNGPVPKAIAQGKLSEPLIMQSHGRRAQAIESGDLTIDVAFIAVPTIDKKGNGGGAEGKSACGILGYAVADMLYAKHKVAITDNLVEETRALDIRGEYIDYIVNVDQIGDPKGIVSGTTKITTDPIGLKIARDTSQLLDELGMIKPGLTFQTGAGGTSLAVADEVRKVMKERKIVGRFASGGITGYLVNMFEDGLFEHINDVQCFDLEAIRSYRDNENHHGISASEYANPYLKDAIAHQLDVVILGATEIDKHFNVNVTTDSRGNIIGGSGGHQDTAYGAKITIITTSLIKSRIPILRDEVTSITTPGETVDVLVTERGIAINPRRVDLLEKLKSTKLNVMSIEKMMDISNQRTGVPLVTSHSNTPIGYIEYRDGTLIDTLYKI